MVHIKKDVKKIELYGICGLKGHGKDTFANMISDKNSKFTLHHFANSLKNMTSRIFGLSNDQMFNPSKKEIEFDNPIFMDEYIELMKKETGLDIKKADCLATSPRTLMQYFGTEYIRKEDPNFWSNYLFDRINIKNKILIPDLRFENEAEKIINSGGKIIKIIRIDAHKADDVHASESSIDNIEPDLVIGSVTGDLSLPQKIAHLISIGKYESSKSYDYRKILLAKEEYEAGASAEKASKILGFKGKDPYALYNILDYYGIKSRQRKTNKKDHKVINGDISKECGNCFKFLELKMFNLTSKNWDGLHGFCRECQSIENKKKYEKYGKIDGLSKILQRCKKNSKYRDLKFELELQDIEDLWSKQGGKCFYSGKKMSQETKIDNDCKVTIDRINSDHGYLKDNIVLCTYRANIMKSNLSTEDFLSVVTSIFNNKCSQPNNKQA